MPSQRAATNENDVHEQVLVEFLSLMAADRLGEGVQPLRHYLEAFPEHETLIACEYLSLTGATQPSDSAPPPSTSTPVTTLGDYTLQRELGRGGQAIVYLAEDTKLKRLVALKVVPPSLLSSGLSRRLEREARVTSQLEHPGICPVYAVGSSSVGAWIAMRYIEGRTLAQVLSARIAAGERVAPLDDVTLVEQIARAVDAAHAVGVVHRDIKPANIMVQEDGTPVVLDFGLAHSEEEDAALTRTGSTPGTPAYMAPEQIAGAPMDPRADVWALGTVLYEALIGRRPFEAPTQTALAQAITRDALPDPRKFRPEISRDLSVVLQSALCKEPAGRYSSARAFADDLTCLRERRPVSARPAGPLLKLRRWAARHPSIAVSLSLVLITLIGATALSQKLLGETREALADRTIALAQKDVAFAEKEAALTEKDAALVQKQQALDDEAEALGQVTRLADLRVTQLLVNEEPALWPAIPEQVEAMTEWLDRAQVLLDRREIHDETLRSVLDRLEQSDSALVSQQGARLDRDTDLWVAEQLSQLLQTLETLVPQRDSVFARREFARSLEANTIAGPEAAWTRSADLVAADPRFDGLILVAQRGLMPLGPDPASKLVEFAVFGTGTIPSRDDAGALPIDQDSAIVLILVPGGPTRVGAAQPASDEAPDAPHVDTHARNQDGPVVDVFLDPFFISKYEMTQGQWLRHTGKNPATYVEGKPWVDKNRPLMHPVETITWHDAERVLGQLGLAMPSEAQWEYAARAGTTTDWWTGDDVRSIDGAGNLGDLTSRNEGGNADWEFEYWLTDGWSVHAPVGEYRANPFGLHNVLGNVAEWCGDLWQHWGLNPPRDGDGMSIGIDEAPVYRGGNYAQNAQAARSASRNGLPAEMRIYNLGVRPSRALTR